MSGNLNKSDVFFRRLVEFVVGLIFEQVRNGNVGTMPRPISRVHREAVWEKEAVFLDCDMSSKFNELLEDSTMTERKWREWLPIFEAADLEIKTKCPHLPLGRTSEYVRRIIGEGLHDQPTG